ncbi:MAG: hypothetical protein GC199_03385 [Alphaproteobacteria bacterium]|nr:hypothetical protein [Alphaproteobacteria bacterium]
MSPIIRLPVVSAGLIVLTLALGSGPALAGPPWTQEEFFTNLQFTTVINNRERLEDWWQKQPAYLQQRILNSEERMWWPIILCNYFGYKPGAEARASAEQCENNIRTDHDRGLEEWTQNGEYKGASESCRTRNQRDQYGRLVCG